MRLITIIIIFFANCTICPAQKILKHLTTDEGFSEMKCFDVYQDTKGFIWIGTSAGANKYDGKDVISFDRSKGVLSDHIYSFHEDSKQRIWINNLNGEPLFIKDNEVHNRFTDPFLEEIKDDRYLADWVEDKYNRIWFAHKKGRIDILDKDSIHSLFTPEKLDSIDNELYCIFPYHNEMIISTSFYLKSIDLETFETNWIFPIQDIKAIQRKVLYRDKLYLLHLSEAYVFDLETRELKTLERFDGSPPIYDCRIFYDEVWIINEEVLSIVRDSGIVDLELHPSIDSIAVSAVHEDNHGDLWIATRDNGVYFYYDSDIESSKFSKYCNIEGIEEFSDDSIFIFQEDWSVSLLKDDQLKWKKSLEKKDENRFNHVFRKDGELWIADKYHIHIDVEGDYKFFGIYNRQVYYDDDTKDFIWIGTKGISILDDINLILKYDNMYDLVSTKVDFPKEYLIDNPYRFVMVDSQEIWVASEEGLYHINDNKMVRLENPEFNGSITEIKMKDNHLIGVNYGIGIFDFDLKTGYVELLSQKDGLPSNYFAHFDMKDDNIWVSHATGLCLLKIDENGLSVVKNYGKEHGVPEGRITKLKIIDDVCHFIVNGHAYSVKPKQVINDTLEIRLDTSALTYFTGTSQSVSFDCVNFAFADKINYEYRLMPLDSTWTEVNGEKVDLEYIPAGNYDLEVRTYHPLNLVNPIKRKPIHVKEKWYNENYFRCTVLFLFGFVLFFLFRIKALSFNTANFKHWVAKKIQKYFVKEQRNSFNLKDINGVVHLLKTNEIKFIKSSGNYLEYHTDKRKYVSRMTMSKAVEEFKMWTDMERVHRSYMVNFSMIEAIDHNFLKVGSVNIPFTERYKEIIEQKLQL